VIAIDPIGYRRNLALKLGAEFSIDPNDKSFSSIISEITDGIGPDVCIECTGSEKVLLSALSTLKQGGGCGLVGELEIVNKLDFSRWIIHKDLKIAGSWIYDNDKVNDLVTLIRSGLEPEKIVTHRFPIEDSFKAWQVFDKGETGKVLMMPNLK